MLRRALLLILVFIVLFSLARCILVGSGTEPSPAPSPSAGKTPPVAAGPSLGPLGSIGKVAPGDRPAAAPQAQPPTLVGYRAVYKLSLRQAQNGAGVSDVDGRMLMEFSDTCDGYALTQRVEMKLSDDDGSATMSDFRVANWEAHDGSRFRFSTRHIVNGQTNEDFEGSVERKPDGSGTITFAKPDEKTQDMPKGTIFPSLHTLELIKAAQAATPVFATKLFDGTGTDPAYDVVAAIGKTLDASPAQLKDDEGAKILKGLPSWPVQLSFYDPSKTEELPEYQVSLRLYANGISGDMVLDYGDFSIDTVLTHLELLPPAAC